MIGRSDLYNTVYNLQCTIGHTDSRSMNSYLNLTDEGTIFNIGENWNLVRTTLVIVFDCFFHITKEADKQFVWGLENILSELSKKWSEEVGKMKHENK